MSAYNTPRCRVAWTEVYSGGILRNLVVRDQSLDLRVGWDIDPTLLATPGYYTWTFHLNAIQHPLGPQVSSLAPRGGLGLLSSLPGSALWTNTHWTLASDLVTDEEATYFDFQPRLYINVVGVSGDQFAFPSQSHYILIG